MPHVAMISGWGSIGGAGRRRRRTKKRRRRGALGAAIGTKTALKRCLKRAGGKRGRGKCLARYMKGRR